MKRELVDALVGSRYLFMFIDQELRVEGYNVVD